MRSLTNPHFKHKKLIVSLLILGWFVGSHPVLAQPQDSDNITAEAVITVTNTLRINEHLPALTPQPQLMRAAAAKAARMIADNAWSHNTPTYTPWQFIQNEGYTYAAAGENLGRGYSTANDVVLAWYDSPTHQANLLNPAYTDIGVAVLKGEYLSRPNTTLIVQFLAKPGEPLITPNPPAWLTYITIGLLIIGAASIFLLIAVLYQSFRPVRLRPPSISFWRH